MPQQVVRPDQRFTALPLPALVVDLDGVVLSANPAAGALLGVAPDDLVGRSAAVLAPAPGSQETVQQVAAAARAGVVAGQVRATLRRADGGDVPVEATWFVSQEDDAPPCLVVLLHDESERAQAEQRLLDDEARWRSLLAHSAAVTWTADEQGTVTSVTSSLMQQLGWDAADLIGSQARGWVHEQDRAAFDRAFADLLSGAARTVVLECRLRLPDGGEVWVEETLADLRGDPHVQALVGHVVDVSERRREQATRARHEARFRARFDQSSVPQTVVALDGTLAEANDAYCALVRRPREEVLGKRPATFNAASDPGTVDALLRAVLHGEAASAEGERVLLVDGRPVPVLVRLTALRDEQGRVEGAVAFLQDLAPLRDLERRREEQERFFLALSARASESALVLDEAGTVLYASAGMSQVTGHDPADLLGRSAGELVVEHDREQVAACWQRVLERPGASETLEVCLETPEGLERTVEATFTDQRATPVGGIVANLRDVTDRVRAEEALRASEARFRAIAETAEEGIWAVGPDGRTLYVNGRAAEVLGHPLSALYAGGLALLLGTSAEVGSLPASSRTEVSYAHPDGGARLLRVATSPLVRDDGSVEGTLAVLSDVTETRGLEAELRRAALHDPLTGLPNRALLLDRLEHALARETRGTGVLFLDLDQFTLLNDSRGHAAGDCLLQRVAERLAGAVRPGDTVARTGGDEFAVVCEDVDDEAAREVAEDLLTALHPPLLLDGEQAGPGEAEVHVRASVGVAVSPPHDPEELLRHADAALHAAKRAGRGRVRRADPALTERAEQELSLAADLRRALQDDGLQVHFQPVVDLVTGQLTGMEALTRWEHPVHGAVPPERFVDLAEQHGLARELDRWVMRTALAETAVLRREGALPQHAYVAVNLSARNLADSSLEELVVEQAQEHGLAPASVVLEITEGAVMDDPDVARGLLGRLRARGFNVALDDFGTGYSSLAYLRDLPVTALKVDRSFVRGIEEDRDALAIVTSLVDLARAVGIGTVAEGVETPVQAALLRKAGCRSGQGWLWSRAVPCAQVAHDPRWLTGFAPASLGVPRVPSASERLQVREEHGLELLTSLHARGASPQSIAAALNRQGRRTPEGLRWHAASVGRALAGLSGP